MNAITLESNREYNGSPTIWQGNSEPNLNQPVFHPAYLDLLNQSPCVTWIIDTRTRKYLFISSNTLEYFGYEAENYIEKGQEFQDQIRHPEDRLNSLKLMNRVWTILSKIPSESKSNYKISYDYRIVKPDGKSVRILEQNRVFRQNEAGEITHMLGMCNDITNWKQNDLQLALLASEVDKQYMVFTSDNPAIINPKTVLSKRELEIVKLIAQGFSSKYIADRLFISFHTVNTHRQKMIEKTHTKNTSGLVQFAAFNGLI